MAQLGYYPPIAMPSSGWLSVLQTHFCSYRRVCVFDRLSDCELGPVDSRVPLNVLLSDTQQLLNGDTIDEIISFSSDLWDVLNTRRYPYNGKAPEVKLIDYFAPGCNDNVKVNKAFNAFYDDDDGYDGYQYWISEDDMKRCLLEAVISQEYFFSFAKEISRYILPDDLSRDEVLDLVDPSNGVTRAVTRFLVQNSFYETNFFATASVPGLHCNRVPSIFRTAVQRMSGYYLNERNRTADRLFRERILIDAFGEVTGFNLSLVDILEWMQLINRLHYAVQETPIIASALSVWNTLSGCRQLVESHLPTTDYLMSLSTVVCNATFNTVRKEAPIVYFWKSNASEMESKCKAQNKNYTTSEEDAHCFAWIKSLNFSEAETIALYTLLRGYVLLSPPTFLVKQIARKAEEKLEQLSEFNNFFTILSATAKNIASSFPAAVEPENTRTFTELLFIMLRKFGFPKGEDEKMLELFALTTCALRTDWWTEMGSRVTNALRPVKQLLGCIRTEGRIRVVTSDELQTSVNCLISEYNLLSTVEFRKDTNESTELPSSWEYTINMVDHLLDSNSSLDTDTDGYHFSGYNYPYAIVRDVIDEAIMELHGRNGRKKVGRFVQPFPRKAIVRYPPFYPLLHLPFVYTLFFFVHSMYVLLVAAKERQQGIRSYMTVCGLKWVTFFASFLIRAVLLFMLSGVVLFYVLLDVAVITEATVLWPVALYAASIIAAATQCYLLYAMFPTVCSVMTACTLIYIIGYAAFEVVLYFFSNIDYIVQMILSILLPQLAWSFGCVSVTAYARLEEELSWKKLNVSFFENKNYTVASSMVALQCNSLINIVVALLIDVGVLRQLIHCAKLIMKMLRKRKSGVRTDAEAHFSKSLLHEIPLAPIGLSVSSLSHSFGKSTTKSAGIFKNVTVDFYEGQITVIFGGERSGKSTLMRLLSGLLTPQKGSILVPGKKDKLVMPTFADIAYCPEELCLFENLTVKEHLNLYQALRGGRIRSMACRSIIMETGLMAFSSVRAKRLSLQMKRILQIAMAIVCDAPVWLFDEPTKGLKPTARRIIWNFLIRHRNGRTIIVTSSSYQETETISDRIAILSQKTLLYCGSLTFLRNQTNSGFKVKLRKIPSGDRHIVSVNAENHWTRHVFCRLMPGAEITKYGPDKLHVAIPLVSFRALRKLVAQIERRLSEFACDSYVLSSATFEQVMEKINRTSMARSQLITDTVSTSEEIGCVVSPFCQIEALLKRRYLKLVRDKWALFFMALFPAIFLFMVNKAVSIANSTGRLIEDDVEMTSYSGDNDSLAVFFNFTHPTIRSEAVHWKKYMLRMFRNRRLLKGLDENFTILSSLAEGNCTDQPLDYIPTFVNLYNPKSLVPESDFLYDGKEDGIASWLSRNRLPNEPRKWSGGFSGAASTNVPAAVNYSKLADHVLAIYTNIQRLLGTENNTKNLENEILQLVRNFSLLMPILSVGSNVKIWYPRNSCSSLSKCMSIMSNAMLYAPSSNNNSNVVEIQSHLGSLKTFQLHRMNRLVELEKYTEEMSLRYAAMFAVVVTMSSLGGPVASWAVKEKSSGIKDIVICQGMRTCLYWVTNMIFDVLFHWIAVAIMFPFLQTGCIFPTSAVRSAVAFFLLCSYGFAIVPVVYLLSLPISSPTRTLIDFLILGAVASLGGTFGVLMKDTCPNVVSWKPVVKFISLFIPQFHLSEAIVALNAPCKGDLFVDMFDDGCFVEFGGLKRSLWAIFAIVTMGATAFIVLTAVESSTFKFLVKSSIEKGIRRILRRPPVVPTEEGTSLRSPRIMRSVQEATRDAAIRQTANLIRSIRPGECIGIFGGNGVGKSCVLRMAMARSRASYYGKASFMEVLKNAFTPMRNGFCYCPQWNALDESLTVREMLMFYATLGGVPKAARSSAVNYYLSCFDMSSIGNAKSSSISMGMKRRLSIVPAFMGPCRTLVLDEPTSNVGRQNVKLIHDLLSDCLRKGKSIIMTSQNFKECEILCNHTALLTKRTLLCSVPLKELRERFGFGYLVKIKVSGDYNAQVRMMSKLRSFNAGMTCISKQSSNTFSCQYAVSHQPDAQSILRFLHAASKNCDIQDCSIRPISIGDVFLSGVQTSFIGGIKDAKDFIRRDSKSRRASLKAEAMKLVLPLSKARRSLERVVMSGIGRKSTLSNSITVLSSKLQLSSDFRSITESKKG